MTLGDPFIERIVTHGGRELFVMPLAVEPIADIAVLGISDSQTFAAEEEALEDFCAQTAPVALSTADREVFESFAVHIRTHDGGWIQGLAQQTCPEAHLFWVNANQQVKGGTSGGPVLDDEGQLVGLVSHFSEAASDGRLSNGPIPRPHLTVPPWLLLRINGS